ncbi:hypothetical protein JCM19376_04550 [Fusibacter bizertensis]
MTQTQLKVTDKIKSMTQMGLSVTEYSKTHILSTYILFNKHLQGLEIFYKLTYNDFK